jgi:2-C-methyl-D-erythritol 4-phosphate cytidylyltransferase
MVDHVIDNLTTIPDIDIVYVVTNDKFADHFQRWADNYPHSHHFSFEIVNDKHHRTKRTDSVQLAT